MPKKLDPNKVVPTRELPAPQPKVATGAAEGDLGGFYPNPVVLRINGTTVPPVMPGDITKVLTVSNDTPGQQAATWQPGGGGPSPPPPPPGSGFVPGGDISAPGPSFTPQTVIALKGMPTPDPTGAVPGENIQLAVVGTPLWAGAAGIAFDGALLWVSDGDTSGSNNSPDPRVAFIRLIDPTQNPPVHVGDIDLSAYLPYQNVRQIRKSSDGTKMYACIKGNNDGAIPNTVPGRCLIIDIATKTVVGNAEMATGTVGSPSGFFATGARDAVDDGAGHLFVVNSNFSTSNIVEKFDIATVLANGTSPTTSIQQINIPNHAEELCFGAGFIWTGGSAYTQVVTQINPSTGSIVEYTDPTYFIWGMTFAFGALWAGDFNGHVLRFDPALFPGPSFRTDVLTSPNFTDCENAFASDGTFLWFGDLGSHFGNTDIIKIDPTPGSVHVVTTLTLTDSSHFNAGPQSMCFDGTYIWGARRFSYGTPTGNSSLCKIKVTPGSEAILISAYDGTMLGMEYSPNWFPNGPAGDGTLFTSLSGTYPSPYVEKVGGTQFPAVDQTSQGGQIPMILPSQTNPPTVQWQAIPDGDNGISHRMGLSFGVQQTRTAAVDVLDSTILSGLTVIHDACLVNLRTKTAGATSVVDPGEYIAALCTLTGPNQTLVLLEPLTGGVVGTYSLGVSGYSRIAFVGNIQDIGASTAEYVILYGAGTMLRYDLVGASGNSVTLPRGCEARCRGYFDGYTFWFGDTSPGVSMLVNPAQNLTAQATAANVGGFGNDPHVVDIVGDGSIVYYYYDSAGGSPYYYATIGTLNPDGSAGPFRVPENLGPGFFQPPSSMTFDGKHLWLTSGSSTNNPFVTRLDRFSLTSDITSGWLEVSTIPGPATLFFDGQYVWLTASSNTFTSSDTVYKIDPTRRMTFDLNSLFANITDVGSNFTGFNKPTTVVSGNWSRDGASAYVISSGDVKLRAIEDEHNSRVRTLKVTGGFVNHVKQITQASFPTPYIVLPTDSTIAVGTTTTAYAITLPANAAIGRRITIKDDAGTAGTRNITVSASGGANIDGSASLVLNVNKQSRTLEFNGTQWDIVGGYL